jgi:hypothetical protein
MSSGHQAEASLLATFSQPRCMPSSMSSCLEIFSGLSSWLQGVGKTLSSLIPPLHRKHLPGWGDLPLPWPPSASWVLAILTHCGQRSVLGGKADKCPRAGSAHQLGPPWHHGNQNAPVHVVSQDGIERSRALLPLGPAVCMITPCLPNVASRPELISQESGGRLPRVSCRSHVELRSWLKMAV